MKLKEISFFTPAFNEEANVENTVRKADKVLRQIAKKYEIIVVNDGSADKTGQIADRLAKENSRVRVIHHPQRRRYGGALKSGFYAARYEWVVCMDVDGQFDFAEIKKFLPFRNEADLIIGYRIKRVDGLLRVFLQKIMAAVNLFLFGLTVKDVDCGFKMVKKEVIEKIDRLQVDVAFVETELLFKARRAGFKIAQVPVHHYPRAEGEQTGDDLDTILKSIREGLELRWALVEKKKEVLLGLGVVFLAAFLRLYRLPEYMTFLGDEGRDAIAVKRMIVDHKFRLIGPVTSIGNMYLGPLYYYLISPALFLAGLSPVGPAVMVALMGVVTVGLIWWVGQEWFGPRVGLLAAGLYAISPVVIAHSRSSWNPNVMPFFALLTIWGLWQVWQKQRFWWLPIMGITLSFALQSHYLGLLLLPTVGLFWLATARMLKPDFRRRSKTREFILYTLYFILLLLLLTVLPLVWFDFRHGFINFNAFRQFFTVRQATVNLKFYKGIPQLWTLVTQIFTRLLAGKDEFWGKWLTILIIGLFFPLTILLDSNIVRRKKKALGLVLVWFLVGLLGLVNYKQHVYDHYFGFFFPVPFLLAGWVIGCLWQSVKAGKVAAIVLGIILVFLALRENPFRYSPANQLARTQTIARFIIEKAEEKPFNLALIAERNYHDAYGYFMEIWGTPSTAIEPLKAEETITDQLFVICEKLPCQPINHPLAEIASFGWAEIEQKWEQEGVEVYKLIHTDQKEG